MKRRKKKHSGFSRAQKFFNAKTRVWTWESELSPSGDQWAYAEKCMGAFWKRLDPATTGRVINEPQNWCICVRLVRRYGNDYRVDTDIFIVKSLRLNDLEDLYENSRAELMQPVKTNDIYDIGWMAETFTSVPPDDNENWHLKKLDESYRITEKCMNQWRASNESLPKD